MGAPAPTLPRAYRYPLRRRLRGLVAPLVYPRTDFRRYLPAWRGIPGWLSHDEALWLFEAAKQPAPPGDIVEIGSAWGRGTVCLGLGARLAGGGRVHAVDPHTGGKWARTRHAGGAELASSYAGLCARIRQFGLEAWIAPLVATSEAALAGWGGQPIRLVFVDGWHAYEAVLHDVAGWTAHVVPGGMVAVHDYDHAEVRAAVADALPMLGLSTGALALIGPRLAWFRTRR
jgi:hypothetical protein